MQPDQGVGQPLVIAGEPPKADDQAKLRSPTQRWGSKTKPAQAPSMKQRSERADAT
ncbi:MAG TPA: hypothetical protein VKQ36_08190 [Ktedonobacterales bacterium]|nr:hypothetical protein [Ktedonobacterales bacterium]